MTTSGALALRIPDLAGKAVLITGSSTGIGATLALAFARQGARIAVHYNTSRDAAEQVAGAIADIGGKASVIGGDMSRSDETERVVREAAAALDGLDGLINNAGLMLGRVGLDEMDDRQYDAVMNLNARSVLMATRAARPWLRRNGGFVINTTSIAARNGGAGGAALYGAAKAFVSNLTRGLSKELIADGIRVNAVSPGVVLTPFHDRYSTPAQLDAMLKTIPAGRLGEPDDCVGAYLFLASNALSGYVVGQIIEVNGGQYMP